MDVRAHGARSETRVTELLDDPFVAGVAGHLGPRGGERRDAERRHRDTPGSSRLDGRPPGRADLGGEVREVRGGVGVRLHHVPEQLGLEVVGAGATLLGRVPVAAQHVGRQADQLTGAGVDEEELLLHPDLAHPPILPGRRLRHTIGAP